MLLISLKFFPLETNSVGLMLYTLPEQFIILSELLNLLLIFSVFMFKVPYLSFYLCKPSLQTCMFSLKCFVVLLSILYGILG